VLNIRCANISVDNVAVSDITGRSVYNAAIAGKDNASKAKIDISTLPQGLYFVKVNGREVRKFVKE